MVEINQAAVIGAGVMGAGIAAHLANAGIDVMLLDIVPGGAVNRNQIAEGAIDKLLHTDPAPLTHKRNAKRITPGNIEDDLAALSGCDWIIEAVIEQLDIKQDLYRKIEAVRKPGSVVSSNTSTLPLKRLVQGLPQTFARDFMITHFFNPPRYMRLLEIVAGEATRAEAVSQITTFADYRLGKTIVLCHDTPGFIANRIGTFWLQCAVTTAMEMGVGVEEADAVLGQPMGIPKTGAFGLIDLVGLDLMPHILGSLREALPKTDPFHEVYRQSDLVDRMIADGYTGRKGKGGFYRLNRSTGEKIKEVIDLNSGTYAPARRPRPGAVTAAKSGGMRALFDHGDTTSDYAWRVMSKTLAYAASLVPEIADDITAIDAAMRLGYNWKWGPFELIDKLGAAWLRTRLRAEGRDVAKLLDRVGKQGFYKLEGGVRHHFGIDGNYHAVSKGQGILLLCDIKLKQQPVAKNRSASLWDIGDGVVCLEFHSKMNSLNMGILSMIDKAIKLVPGRYKALVIYNEGSNFSVGANLALLLVPAMLRLHFIITAMVGRGQRIYRALKYAPFPVVAAPANMALGGGCEILLHCDHVQAHCETYTGLVETGVGVIPAWGGSTAMLGRWWLSKTRKGGPMVPVIKVFEILSMATVSKSADEAHDYLFLRDTDGITMNRDRLLADAKAQALALVENYVAPKPTEVSPPGPSAKAALAMAVAGYHKRGIATAHDMVVAGALADVLSGGGTDLTETVSEDEMLALERHAFTRLTRTAATRARIRHTLKTGKPLRN